MISPATPLLPFTFADPGAIWLALLVAVAAFIAMRFLTRDIMVNELELFVMTNITMAFSVALVFSYWRIGEMWTVDLELILALIAVFYVSVFVTAKLLGVKALKEISKPAAALTVAEDPHRNAALVLSFLIGVPALIVLSLGSLRGGFNSQYEVQRESGGLRLLMEGGVPLFLYFAFGTNIVARKFLNILPIALVLAIGPLGGAKSAVLADLLTFFTVAGLLRPEISFKRLAKFGPLLILALPTMLIPFLLQGQSAQVGAFQSFIRFFLSGDVYYYTFIAARPDMFYHFYDWSSYLLHPFLVMLGQRAYEYPLGSLLASHYFGTETVSGPNPHATVLGLVLFNGNVILAASFCAALGVLTALMRYGAFKIFLTPRLPPVVRSLVAATLTFQSPILFLDFGTAERYMLGNLVTSVLIFVACLTIEVAERRHQVDSPN